MNATFDDVFRGRGYTLPSDYLVGLPTLTFSFLQITVGCVNLWILKNLPIFHNAFGFFCALRTLVEILSNSVHLFFSAPMTLLQIRSIHPMFSILAGYLGYSLSSIACTLHVTLSINRFACVYFPLRYKTLFCIKNCAICFAAMPLLIFPYMSLFYVIPCNSLGYSPSYYGYIALGCPRSPDAFSFSDTANYGCGVFLCFTAISIDVVTLRKILKLKSYQKHNLGSTEFKRNVRFFVQSASQNGPMLLDIVILTLGANSIDDSKAFHRSFSFVLTRFTDFLNAMTLVLFIPEARRFLFKYETQHHVQVASVSGISSS